MDTLRSTAHLQRQLGDGWFAALISSDNTEAVRQFAKTLSIMITVGDRIYGGIFLHKVGEESVKINMMVKRAGELNIHSDEDDLEYMLKHQDEIPAFLRGEVEFVFTDDVHPNDPDDPELPESVSCANWCNVDNRWVESRRWTGHNWRGSYRVLRRIK